MSQEKHLYESVGKAMEDLRGRQEKSEKAAGGKEKKSRVPLWRVAVLAMLAVILLYFRSTDDMHAKLQEDLRLATVDLIMEADAEVYTYYDHHGRLPEQLDSAPLGWRVVYKKIDDTHFTLQLTAGAHQNVVVKRDIRKDFLPSDLMRLLS
jgi:hypothetical protein